MECESVEMDATEADEGSTWKNIELRLESIETSTKFLAEAVDELIRIESSLTSEEKVKEQCVGSFLYNLNDILDFCWGALCHLYSSKGQGEAVFPYKVNGVKIPHDLNHCNHDEREKYLKPRKGIFKNWDKLPEDREQEITQAIGKIILRLQPMQEVNGAGAPVGQPQYQPYDKEVFTIIRSCRNTNTHRHLVEVYSKYSLVEVCPREGTIRLVDPNQRRNDRSFIYIGLDKLLLQMKMPTERFPKGIDRRDRPFMPLISQSVEVVINVVDDLLHTARLLPHGHTICNQSDKMQQYIENWPDLSALDIPTEMKNSLCEHLISGIPYVTEDGMMYVIKALRKTTYAKSIFGARPSMRDFAIICSVYKDDSREFLSIARKGRHRWREIATTFLPDNTVSEVYEEYDDFPEYCLLQILVTYFLTDVIPNCNGYTRDWNGVIDLFEDLGETALAEEIIEAILNEDNDFDWYLPPYSDDLLDYYCSLACMIFLGVIA